MILLKPSATVEFMLPYDEILIVIERAARTCYKSEEGHDKSVEKLLADPKFEPHLQAIIGDTRKEAAHRMVSERFVRGLLKKHHESTIEHVYASVRLVIDRGVSHEQVRHRLAAYSQESTRYVDYTGDKTNGHCQFIIPPWCKLEPGVYTFEARSWSEGDMAAGGTVFVKDGEPLWPLETGCPDDEYPTYCWLRAMHECEEAYQTLREKGWSAQQARSVLPNSTKTEIVVTANLREMRHIFRMRTSPAAHPQMREVMVPLLKEFQTRCPVLFNDIGQNEENDGVFDTLFNLYNKGSLNIDTVMGLLKLPDVGRVLKENAAEVRRLLGR